jgi:cyclophilin family peptidyl-prolyl cis-trans isomerase
MIIIVVSKKYYFCFIKQIIMSKYLFFIIFPFLMFACKPDLRLFGADVRQTIMQFGKENPENEVIFHTSQGDFTIKLYDETLLHRANFIRLVKGKFYDERYFYRNVYETAIQGGAEWSKLDYDLPTEVDTTKFRHKLGALSMAQYDVADNPKLNTSSSEFFIVTNPQEAKNFDGIYTVIGEVTAGMEVVEKIKNARSFDEKPVLPVKFSIEIKK